MRLVMLVFLTLPMAAVVFAADLTPPCAHWEDRFPTPLTHASIPPILQGILRAHYGQGFSTTFEEEKRVALLKRPLRSSGQLIFIPPYGLYRQLTRPFRQELLITSAALHQRSETGLVQTLTLDQLPVAKAFVEAFLATFSGSWDRLQVHFQVFFTIDAQRWQMGLKPAHPMMAKQITCLVLEGQHEQLTQLSVQETNGDSTVDRFHHPQLLPESTWMTYRSQFEWPP